MADSVPSWEPEGPLVSSIPATAPSTEKTLVGRHVDLVPLRESHAEELYHDLGGTQRGPLYKYLHDGPYADIEAFTAFIKSVCDHSSLVPYAIRSKSPSTHAEHGSEEERAGSLTGIITYLNIVPSYRSIEIGLVLFGPRLGRTTAATETCYLMMKHAFQDLHFLRVEWKANVLNEPSKRAALRLGFVYEGVFRKHMVVKGRSRDSVYFSVIDEEWEGGVREALERWLRNDNFDDQGGQKFRLEEIRKGIIDQK
jgi:RimJ/RimL family protein N-acetyltransferase